MLESMSAGRAVSRREFVAIGGTIAAAGALAPLVDPLAALGAGKWPSGRLGAKDATRVDRDQFMPLGQFRRWHEQLDQVGPSNQRGLRATGSTGHEGYVDELRDRLDRAGVQQLHFEPVPMKRWTTSDWSLELTGGAAAGEVKTSSYIPYSGKTPKQGVTGELVFVAAGATPAPGSLAGKIAVFDVPVLSIPLTVLTSLAYEGRSYDPQGQLAGDQLYKRPYLSIETVIEMIEKLTVAGAAGAVGVIDFPFEGAKGTYFPYDGVIREVPGVYVDREVGATLKQQAQAGTSARLRLPASVKKVKSRNLLGIIPGQSKEIVTLHCHTDGSNALEDNGPDAIVAMAQYLARLPRKALPRTILILLTTGHFAGGNGTRSYLSRHEGDFVKRTNAALTIEHLGLKEWNELPSGEMGLTGNWEPGAIFAPGSSALVDASFKALKRAKAKPAGVLKPLYPNGSGQPNDPVWPGEGQYLYGIGGIPTANYITGPTYLLNWGVKTADKVSFRRVRNEAIAFTEEILRLGRTPGADLKTYDLG